MKLRLLGFLLSIFPFASYAQTGPAPAPGGTPGPAPNPSGGGLMNPLGDGTTLIGFFQEILDVIMIFAVPIIVFFIIYAGFLYVTAQGNQTKVETAHRALLYAVIGGVLIIGAEVLLAVIGGTVDALGS